MAAAGQKKLLQGSSCPSTSASSGPEIQRVADECPAANMVSRPWSSNGSRRASADKRPKPTASSCAVGKRMPLLLLPLFGLVLLLLALTSGSLAEDTTATTMATTAASSNIANETEMITALLPNTTTATTTSSVTTSSYSQSNSTSLPTIISSSADLNANTSSTTASPTNSTTTNEATSSEKPGMIEEFFNRSIASTAADLFNNNNSSASSGGRHFQLISLNWTHVQTPFGLSLWLLLASIAKILFNLDKRVAEAVPDSALLIVLGLLLGMFLRLFGVDATLPSNTFFLYLLPPIIFDAGYFMPNRQLFENLDSVLLFAFCGTIWNTLAIGFSLLWLSQLCLFSIPFTAFEILLFASLISAVDPVAVIAVFEQIHINEFLFINVFGEALFNDGVSVVLYQMFRKFILIGEENLLPIDYIAGIGSFLVIALGGILIGLLFATITSLATKYTRQVPILAPVFIFVVPYLSYLAAELFGLSSILAIVACGIAMKQYVKGNLSHDANSSVKYFVKMLAQCSETMIFMFLGLSTVSRNHHWDWAFVGATIGFCLLHRIVGVVVQCWLLNRFRTKKFSLSDQFVLSYGGLRGAIAFGLVISLDEHPVKQMFVTTCIAVIFFTVFVQGITIRPLLYWLRVEKQDMDKEETMIEKIYTRYCDYMMAGLEDIAGQKGRNAFRDTFERFNAKLMKPVLMRGEKARSVDTSSIVRAYTKITLLEAHRLARTSIRKRPGSAGRVAPASSPSSATSTLTHCWTTTTTVANNHHQHTIRMMANGKAQRGLSESSGDGASANGGGGGTNGGERPPSSAAHSMRSCEDKVNPAELGQYLAQPENTEALYELFSRLLDRKLMELHGQKIIVDQQQQQKAVVADKEKEDDIKDNYLEALIPARDAEAKAVTQLLSPAPLRKQSKSGGAANGRRRHSLGAALERQIGSTVAPVSPEYIRGVVAAQRLFISETSPGLPKEGEQPQQRRQKTRPRNLDMNKDAELGRDIP